MNKIPYKTCCLLIHLGPFSEKGPKSINKALSFPLKVDDVLRLCKTPKTVSKTTFWSFQKCCSEYLIKPVEYEDFRDRFCKMASKSIKKHYVSHYKLMTFYDFEKHQKTISKTTFWSFQKSWTKYLIKPVVYWSFWGPFRKVLDFH